MPTPSPLLRALMSRAMDEAPMPAAEPSLGAAGILYIADTGRVLLLKRGAGSKAYPLTWGLPGGHIEPGESPMQAAIRESQEETGHAPTTNLELLRDIDGFTLFVSREAEFPASLCYESDGYVWARPDDLPQPLHPGTAEAIEAAQRAIEPEPVAAMDFSDLGTRMAFGDAWAADRTESARVIDTNGWFEVKGNPISKVGVFPYRGAQLNDAPDPEAMYRVYRPAEELSDPDCIASFRLLPWIDNHTMLGDDSLDLTPAERKGVQGVIGEDIYFEAPYLRANLKVFSQHLASLIDAGKRELSAGYRCKYEWTPGVFEGQPYDCVQRRIRGNHIASVMSGRMGPDVAVLDESPDQETQPTAKEPSMAEENKSGGGSGMTLEDAVAAIKSLAPAITSLLALAGGATGATETTTDAEVVEGEKKNDEEEGAKAAGMDAAPAKPDQPAKPAAPAIDMNAMFREAVAASKRRDALAGKVSEHVGTFDAADMTEAEVAAYGCEKLGIKVEKGQEIPAITGYLAAAVAPRNERMAAGAMDAAPGDNFVTRHLNSMKGA